MPMPAVLRREVTVCTFQASRTFATTMVRRTCRPQRRLSRWRHPSPYLKVFGHDSATICTRQTTEAVSTTLLGAGAGSSQN